jgi:hypothetical protein
MRQIGNPPAIDEQMAKAVLGVFAELGVATKDSDASTGGKDFLERILGLIRGTGFTVAIFSHDTRATAMANIMLELGFAAMCGKPFVIIKSKEAAAPSDFTRTDWIDYDPKDEPRFRHKLTQALDTLRELAAYEETLLEVALNAKLMDCAVAFERANKAFLLTGEARFIDAAQSINDRLEAAANVESIADLDRLHDEIAAFIKQGRRALAASIAL